MKATGLLKFLGMVTAIFAMAFAGTAAADGLTLTTMRTNIDSTVVTVASILTDVALVAGIGFILASFFKFHQHKLNPTQVPISQGVTLLVIGTALTAFVLLIPVATKSVFGDSTNPTKVGGSDMKNLIDGTGGG